MKLMRVRLFAFLVLLGFLSCKDNLDSYPITYHTSLVSETVSRIFTKDGELLDLAKKKDFENRYGILLDEMLNESILRNVIAVYTSPETVLFKHYGTEYFDTLTVVEKSDVIYWEHKDTTTLIRRNPIKDLFVYSPLYKEEFKIYSMPHIYNAIRTKYSYFVIKDGDKLIFPVVGIFFKWEFDNGFAQAYGYLNNKFNAGAVDYLSINDTILVNEFYYDLKCFN